MDSPKPSQRSDYHTRRPREPTTDSPPQRRDQCSRGSRESATFSPSQRRDQYRGGPRNPLRTPCSKEETSIQEEDYGHSFPKSAVIIVMKEIM